jgi:hypothetical protein
MVTGGYGGDEVFWPLGFGCAVALFWRVGLFCADRDLGAKVKIAAVDIAPTARIAAYPDGQGSFCRQAFNAPTPQSSGMAARVTEPRSPTDPSARRGRSE